MSSGLPINWTDDDDVSVKPLNYGWRMALPAGERVLGTGFVRDARYHFSSINPTVVNTNPPNGENWLNEFDYLTSGVGSKLIFDLSNDSLLTDSDRIADGSGVPIAGATGIPVSVYQGGGLLSQPLLAILSAQLSTTIFNKNPFFDANSQPAVPAPPPVAVADPGVTGGHFDVDIYNKGGKVKHTHEYDDKFDVTGVNFLAPSDPEFHVTEVLGPGEPFKILISNQPYSPAVNISYGGLPYENVTKMTTYTTAGLKMADLPQFTSADVTTLKFNMPKNAFEVKDWAGTGDLRVGLMPTETGCVNKDPETTGKVGPAPHKLYRNGALTIQLVKHITGDSEIEMASAAGDPSFGYRIKLSERNSDLIAEYTVFWHHPMKECLGDSGWVKDPPQDLSAPDPSKFETPAPGSQDPPRDVWGTAEGVVVTVEDDPDEDKDKYTIRTTITTYSSGVIVTVKEWLKDDKVKKVEVATFIPTGSGGAGGASSGGNGVSQALAASNVVTGYQQTRNSGKLGRVTWHELLAP